MENYLTPYESVIAEIKSIISSGQEAAYLLEYRQTNCRAGTGRQ